MSPNPFRSTDAIRLSLPRFTAVEMFCCVAVIGLVTWTCSRPEIAAHEIALVIMLAIVTTTCIRQLISFFGANSILGDPNLRNVRVSIIVLRSIGCVLLVNSIFDWIPSLPPELRSESGKDPKFILDNASVCLGLALVLMPGFKSASRIFGDNRRLLLTFTRVVIFAFAGLSVIVAALPVFLNLAAVFAIELAILNPARMGSPNLTDENARNVANRLAFADMSLLSILATLTTVFGFHCLIGKKTLRDRAVMGLLLFASLATNTAFLIWVYHAGIKSLTAIPIEIAFYVNAWHFARLISIALVLVAICTLIDFGIANGSTHYLTNGIRNRTDLPPAIYAMVPLVWFVGSFFPVDPDQNPGFFFDIALKAKHPIEPSGISLVFVEIWLLKIALAAICISKLNLPMLFRRCPRRFQAILLITVGIALAALAPGILDYLFPSDWPTVASVLGFIIIIGSFLAWSIILLRRARVTSEDVRRWNEEPNPYIGISFPSPKFWLLVPAYTFAAIITLLSAIWSAFGIISFAN